MHLLIVWYSLQIYLFLDYSMLHSHMHNVIILTVWFTNPGPVCQQYLDTNNLLCSVIHSFNNRYSCFHSFIHLSVQQLIHSYISQFSNLFIQTTLYSLTYSMLMWKSIHSFNNRYSCFHSFIHFSIQCCARMVLILEGNSYHVAHIWYLY